MAAENSCLAEKKVLLKLFDAQLVIAIGTFTEEKSRASSSPWIVATVLETGKELDRFSLVLPAMLL